MAYKKDLATGLIGRAIDTKATSLVLQSGYGASMPTVPFYLTLTPATQLSTQGNSEIVLVTGRTSDTLTITRAQKKTTAKSFAVGDIVAAGSYADDENGVYSTSEIDTGKVWIDGRTIYRKVLRGSFNATASTFTINHGISGLTTSYLMISFTGGWKIGNGGSQVGVQMQSLMYREYPSGNYMFFNGIDQTKFFVTCSYGWGPTFYQIILEYVK